MNRIWNPPAYLIVVPQVVKSHSDNDTSDGEEETNKFSKEDFEHPPFEIDWERRGTVAEQDGLFSKRQESYESSFIKKVEKESFGRDRAQVKDRVAVVIGYNRMRSLSTSVNRLLMEQSEKFAGNPVLNRDIHFFWRPQWVRSKTGKPVEWETVRDFYRELKKRDPQKARLFRQEREGLTSVTEQALRKFYEAYKKTKISADEFFTKQNVPPFTADHIRVFEKKLKCKAAKKAVKNVDAYINLLKKTSIIPYREIRERIVRHEQTRECAEKLQKDKKRPLYMAFQDADVQSMQGLFARYDQALEGHLKKHKMLPEVASGGYKVSDPLNPILEIGVLIDLWIRHFTAQIFPTGIYHPEPNTLVRVKDGETTLEASFLGKGTYTFPQEMPTLIDDLIAKREIQNLSGAFLFDAHAALTTAVPARMQRRFQAFYTNQRKVVRWGETDLTIYKGLSQTHYKHRDWAANLCDAIGVPKQLLFENRWKLSQSDLRNMLISLISRLFSTYDPFEIARRRKSGFQRTMIGILNNYHPGAFSVAPPKDERKKGGSHEDLWRRIDSIDKVPQLLCTIDSFFQKPGTAVRIQQAALQSTKAVVQIYKENLSLDFTELSIAAMMALDNPRDIREATLRLKSPPALPALNEIGSPLHQKVLEAMVEPDWTGKPEFKRAAKALPTDQHRGYLGTYPMHWAAITGNAAAVGILKSCKNWISAIDQPGDAGLLPLHCALRYCADNGEALELIRELATKALVVHVEVREANGFWDFPSWTQSKVMRPSPLLQALEELYYYPETLKLLFRIAEVDQEIQDELLDLAIEMKEDAEGKMEPKKILGYTIRRNCSPETIELLIRLGADFLACEDDLERRSPFAVAIGDDYGSESDRLALIDILADAGYNLLLEDEEGLSPVAYALEKENIPALEKILEKLQGTGWEPTEAESEQIEQLFQTGAQQVRHEEPLNEEIVRDLDFVINSIQEAENLTAKEKARLIQRFKEHKERNHYYEKDGFVNQMRLSRKRRHPK